VNGKSLKNIDAAVVIHDCWLVSDNHRDLCFNFSRQRQQQSRLPRPLSPGASIIDCCPN
jgi:hypothetical protein